MQGGQAPLQAVPKDASKGSGSSLSVSSNSSGLGIRRLGSHRCPGSRELAPDALDLRTEEADRLARGAHILALVAQGLAPASDFLEFVPVHGAIIPRSARI